jgi:hypothetical protein
VHATRARSLFSPLPPPALGDRFGIPKPRESGSVIGADRRPLRQCVPQDQTEWGYSLHVLEPVRPEAVLPDRVLCLPTFSHFLIVNNILNLSLSLSLFPTLGLSVRKGKQCKNLSVYNTYHDNGFRVTDN